MEQAEGWRVGEEKMNLVFEILTRELGSDF